MAIAAAAFSILALFLALGAHMRATRLREELDHVRRTSRANSDRAEELIRALRDEMKSKVSVGKAQGSWFSPRMTIADALKLHPGVKEVLASMKIGGCSGCSASSTETLEQASSGHGVDLAEMLEKMNALMDSAPAAMAPVVDAKAAELAAAAAALPPANGGRVMLAVARADS